MLPLVLDERVLGDAPTFLAIGAHADDIEIGCGATILALTERYPGSTVVWVVLSASGARADEARASAEEFTAQAAARRVVVGEFRDGFLPYHGELVKDLFETLKGEVDPQLVLTHTSDDRHQDHRLAWELTWNTFRSHLILEYEIPKVDGDLGRPNMFMPVTPDTARRKIDGLFRHFGSQRDKHWFTEDLFMALMRLRGMEAVSPTGLAEGFVCRKAVIA